MRRRREKIVIHTVGCPVSVGGGREREGRAETLPLPRGRRDVGAALVALKGDPSLCQVSVMRRVGSDEANRIVAWERPDPRHPWRRMRLGRRYYRPGE